MAEVKYTLSIEEAAELLGVGRSALYDMVRTKELYSIRIGRRILIPRKALDKLCLVDEPAAAAPAAAAPAKVLWKPCPCCEGTGVIGVKPRSELGGVELKRGGG